MYNKAAAALTLAMRPVPVERSGAGWVLLAVSPPHRHPRSPAASRSCAHMRAGGSGGDRDRSARHAEALGTARSAHEDGVARSGSRFHGIAPSGAGTMEKRAPRKKPEETHMTPQDEHSKVLLPERRGGEAPLSGTADGGCAPKVAVEKSRRGGLVTVLAATLHTAGDGGRTMEVVEAVLGPPFPSAGSSPSEEHAARAVDGCRSEGL